MILNIKSLEITAMNKDLFKANNICVNDFECIGLIGNNGSGKSTFLNTLYQQYKDVIPIAYVKQLYNNDENQQFSGGEQSIHNLHVAFDENPLLILADEPDNHLDRDSLKYVINKMQQFQGAIIIVSHNRQVLNHLCNRIWSIENGVLQQYIGNYDDFKKTQQINKKTQQQNYDKVLQERKRLQQSVIQEQQKSSSVKKAPKRMGNSEARLHKMGNQKGKANLDKAAKRMQTRLNKLEQIDKPIEEKAIKLKFEPSLEIHQPSVLYSSNLTLNIGSTSLLQNAKCSLKTNSKTALIGKNGSGKTTLLNAINNGSSQITIAKNVKIGYLSQFTALIDINKTILENAAEKSNYDETSIRGMLAQLLFRGDSIYKKAETLSGGERTRLGLGMLMLGEYNVLLLDEITNHVDLMSVHAIEVALKNYTGTVLFTTHDQDFIQAVADEKWVIVEKSIVAK